jgi:hypothetical protein
MRRLAWRFMAAIVVLVLAVASVRAEHRVALVIGNSAYLHAGKLANPRNDAKAVADALQELGFDVFQGTDLTLAGFSRILTQFASAIQTADVALVFYAGHGAQIDGVNYLIPVDARLDGAGDIADRTVSLQKLQEVMERRPRTNLLFFDACRDNPFLASLSRSAGSARVRQGWANVSPSKGTYIAFASAEGQVASDGDGANSPFTASLLKHIRAPGLDVELMMRQVRQDVLDATKGTQVPWSKSSLVSSFAFAERTGQPQLSLTADSTRVRKGDAIRLTVTPQSACRLTIINVDSRGNSCLLFPNARVPDRVIQAGERYQFPPPGPTGTLRLHQPGEETFIAMCNASASAINAAVRDTKSVTCSKGPDSKVNAKLLEVATFDADEPTAQPAQAVAEDRKQTILSHSITITVTD